MALLGLDIGTTHCKAGLFTPKGEMLSLAIRESQAQQSHQGYAFYDPDCLWRDLSAAIREALGKAMNAEVDAVGIASMAETGLLVNPVTGERYSPLIPWYDTGATPQAERIQATSGGAEGFLRTGIYPSFKCALAKLLWLRDQGLSFDAQSVWLGAADYVAYCLSGSLATDFSLAGRTYAYRLDRREWDGERLAELGLDVDLFPAVRPSGTVLGRVTVDAAEATGLPFGTPVAIAGHDHICAAFAAGVVQPGQAFDSMGTAEALLGAMDERSLTEADYRSGLSYGFHVVPGRLYWMGGLSSSGGSLEWLRGVLGEPPLTYDELDELAGQLSCDPGSLLYYPYLAGSGSPHTDLRIRGAFIGLEASHRRADLLKAIFEGTAYEAEVIRRAGEQATGVPLRTIIAAGGGTRMPHWLQIKADVSGQRYLVPKMPEATLAGAAMLAGIGQGVYSSPVQALGNWKRPVGVVLHPDPEHHERYRERYEQGYLAYQQPLREFTQRAG